MNYTTPDKRQEQVRNALFSSFMPCCKSMKSLWAGIAFCFLSILLPSCLKGKRHIYAKEEPVRDTVQVYHFIISGNKRKGADTATTHSFMRESKAAYKWISSEAARNNVPLFFKEYWPVNKDSNMQHTFFYKLPTTKLQVLLRRTKTKAIIQKRTKTQPQMIGTVGLDEDILDSIAVHVKDSALTKTIRLKNKSYYLYPEDKKLFVFHVLKARKSRILGFYRSGKVVYIGTNKSHVIAHESIHFLGAPDLYIHRYWFGPKRHMVRIKLWDEIMNNGIPRTDNCALYTISNYTAYTLGWTSTIDKKYKPLLKQGYIARFVFTLSLLL